MRHIINIFLALLIIIIIYCLLFGCRYNVEGLENKGQTGQEMCDQYTDEQKCGAVGTQCGWVVSDEYPDGKCLYSP